MTSIAPPELRQIAARLRRPMPPAEMVAAADALGERLGHLALVRNSPFRDAYVAGHFAAALGAASVRLGDDPPDFHIAGVAGCCTFEATETYPPGRRRSDEYRTLAAAQDKRDRLGNGALSPAELALFAAVPDPDDAGQWQARAEATTALLAAAVAPKAAKGYPRGWGLVVLLDLGGFVSSDAELVARMPEGTVAARDAFAEVWVLLRGRAHACWIGGAPADRGQLPL